MGRKKKPENEKATKPGVALDQECRNILSDILEWERAVGNNDLSASQAIRKCMRIAWQKHYSEVFSAYQTTLSPRTEEGKAPAPKSLNGAKQIVRGSESSDGGPSTATKNLSLKTG